MNTETRTRKIAFIVGVCMLAVIVTYGFLIFLVIQNINEASLSSGDILDETNKEEYLHLLKNSINNTEEERAKIAIRFVSEDNVVSFIEQVETLGNRSRARVTLRSVSVEGAKNDTLKLELSASGSFSEISHFLILAEYLPFKIGFEKVSFLKLPETKGSGAWEAFATLKLLSFNGGVDTSDKKIK